MPGQATPAITTKNNQPAQVATIEETFGFRLSGVLHSHKSHSTQGKVDGMSPTKTTGCVSPHGWDSAPTQLAANQYQAGR
jgi:hypothetical protein